MSSPLFEASDPGRIAFQQAREARADGIAVEHFSIRARSLRAETLVRPKHSVRGSRELKDLVTVFESPDIALFALAKSALDDAGIRYVAENELTQDLFGLGRIGSGFSIVTGAPRIRVLPEEADRASEILAEFRS